MYVCERTNVCIYINVEDCVKQGTLTLPEHLVPHPLQGALNCIGCSLA